MGIRYDASARRWVVENDKTDYKFDYPTNADTGRKTDYQIDLPTNLPTNLPTRGSSYTGRTSGTIKEVLTDLYRTYLNRSPADSEVEDWKANLERQGWKRGTGIQENWYQTLRNNVEYSDEAENIRESYFENDLKNKQNANANTQNSQTNALNSQLNNSNQRLNDAARQLNQKNAQLNQEAITLNTQNTAKNQVYNQVVSTASTTQGGDYVPKRDGILNNTLQQLKNVGVPSSDLNEFKKAIEQNYKLFYLTEKLSRWDTALGSAPPYGTFDPLYYKNQNTTVNDAWKKAVAEDDVDITERYGENNYYWQHYTNIGKTQGLRGNKEEDTERANKYTETALTDKELQDIRDLQLGVDSGTISQRLLNIPEVSNEWTKARQGDSYWANLAKQNFLNVEKPEDFSILFRLSDRPEDRQLILTNNVNVGTGITDLEEAINTAVIERKTVDTKKFAALNQTILKDAIAAMKQQKGQQEMLSFFRGFSGFTEVVDINRELENSILGDTGVGAILSMTSGGKAQEKVLGALQNVTGMRNSAVYNWQQWFDKSIKEKYGIDYATFEPLEEKKDVISAFLKTNEKVFDETTGNFKTEFLESAGFTDTKALISFLKSQGEEGENILNTIKNEPGENAASVLTPLMARIEADIKTMDDIKNRDLALGYTAEDKAEMINVEAQFARKYLDEYLNPRFNTSRSMDEFVEYLDIRQQEQSPFVYEDIDASLKKLGQMRGDVYLDQVAQQTDRFFDPNFYFSPTGDKSRVGQYEDQKKTVEEDWEKAKNGDPYWATQIYRFGIDVNNKAAFARMHFEVKGQGKGYDAAEDIVNAGKVQDFISNDVLPALEGEATKAQVAFGAFITPEEFADEVLRGLDPTKTPDAWKEILQRYGLSDYAASLDEVKQYVVEAVRSGSAQEIREQIKYLNEKRQKPTQEILGITYIQRPEDYKDVNAKPTTELYAIFQNSGYKGTEDDFYKDMFPDLDRSEQRLLTKAGKDERLKAYGLDLSSPFSSLGTIESFFPEAQKEVDKETAEEQAKDFYTSYFKISEDQEEEEPAKSKSGQAFLGEFTSMFKGL
jgi:hypothetical protein